MLATYNTFWDLYPQEQIELLKRTTFLFKGSKPSTIDMVRRKLADERARKLKRFNSTGESQNPVSGYLSSLTDNLDTIMSQVVIATSGTNVPWSLIDRIRKSVLGNLAFGPDEFIRSRKRFLKKVRAYLLTNGQKGEKPYCRTVSWFWEVYDLIPFKRDSPNWVDRVQTLTSTRSVGKLSSKATERDVLSFMEQISTRRPEDEVSLDPNRLLRISERINTLAHQVGFLDAATIQLTNTASTDYPKSKGGKICRVREYAFREDIPMINLETGTPTGEMAKKVADRVFYGALMEYIKDPKGLHQLKVVGIPEIGGKSRVPTYGTSARGQILQPFSKMLLEVLKLEPSLKNGLTKTRQAWTFYRRLNFDHIGFDLVASDLKSSTDYAGQTAAKELLLCGLRAIGFQGWILDVIIDLLLGEDRLEYDALDGSTIYETRRTGLLMGDPITKCFLALSSLYAMEYVRDKYPEAQLVWDNTGDDYIVACKGLPEAESVIKDAISQTGMVVSDDDHFMGQPWAHYTEFCVRVPANRYEQYSVQRNCYKAYPCFGDYIRPKALMRATNNFNKVDPRFGRVALLGQESAYMRTSHRDEVAVNTANVIQDITLGLNLEAYIPICFGGGGKVPPKGYVPSWPPSEAKSFLLGLAAWAKEPERYQREIREQQISCARLYQSHMGEKEFANIQPLVEQVENNPRFHKYVIVSSGEQAATNANISSRIYDNPLVVTSKMLAEKIYIFGKLYNELCPDGPEVFNLEFNFERLVRPKPHALFTHYAEDILPEHYNVFSRLDRPYTIYDRKVMEEFSIMDIRRPTIRSLLGITTQEGRDLRQMYELPLALLKAKENPRDWVNIPREELDDDVVIELIRRKSELKVQVITNDKKLAETNSWRYPPPTISELLFSVKDIQSPSDTALSEIDMITVIDTGNYAGLDAVCHDGTILTRREVDLLFSHFRSGVQAPVKETGPDGKLISRKELFDKL